MSQGRALRTLFDLTQRFARCLLLLVAAPARLDVAEADPRFGAFDFSSAYEEAPADLQELLDSHESLPFRRRG